MKSIEKLQRVVNAIRDVRGQENEATVKFACNLINEFLIDNETAPKGKADLFDICKRTEKCRLPLTGVFHDAEHEMAVSTDAHILVATKADYNPEFAGKIVDKYGNEIQAKFPNWISIVPCADNDMYRYNNELTIDADVCRRAIKAEKAYVKQNGIKRNKTIMFPIVKVKAGNENFFFKAEEMLIASAFATTFEANYSHQPVFFKSEDKVVLIMPFYMSQVCQPNLTDEMIDGNVAFSVFGNEVTPLF